jgi:cation diffusion facilitator family transporter
MSIQKKATTISLIVSCLVLILKLYAYTQTKSTGILSDALETTVNVITAFVALVVIRYAIEPADQEHPYGHGKIEYFSAAFEGGIIFFAALAIIFESIKSLVHDHQIQDISSGIIYILIATALNAATGFYLLKVGKQNKSAALLASGAHLMSDVKTTVGVIVGLIIYKITNLAWIDSAIGILVGSWLLFESYKILKNNLGGLLDQIDIVSVKELCSKMNKHLEPSIIDIHNLRIIRSGNFHHIDAHIVVPEYYDIKSVHTIIERFEKNVVQDYSFDGEFAFHTDPCQAKYCKSCFVENCQIRKSAFVEKSEFNYQHIISGPQHKNKL